jgi:hypothetical protein
MKKIILTLSVMFIVSNCFSGNYSETTHITTPVNDSLKKLPHFKQIVLNASVNLYIKQTDNQYYGAKFDNINQKEIELKVENGTLYINPKKSKNLPEKVTIYVGDLSGITIQSSGNVYQKGDWVFQSLSLTTNASGDFLLENIISKTYVNLTITGSGNIKIRQLTAIKLSNNVAGSGDITINEIKHCQDMKSNVAGSGDINIASITTVGVNEVNIAGSGKCKFDKLPTYTAYVNIAGSGEAYVNSISLLEVSIIGSGDVYFRGKPHLTQNVLGSGKVIKN